MMPMNSAYCSAGLADVAAAGAPAVMHQRAEEAEDRRRRADGECRAPKNGIDNKNSMRAQREADDAGDGVDDDHPPGAVEVGDLRARAGESTAR